LYISIPNDYITANRSTPFYWNQGAVGAIVIDWGDGTIDTITNTTTGNKNKVHKYTSPGDYIIEIEVTSGTIRLGYWGSNQSIIGTDVCCKCFVTKVEIGDGVIGLCRNTFDNLPFLKSVSIPITCINHDTGNDYAIFNGQELTGIVFPAGTPG